MKIGVISDTHGYFDPKIPSFFDGVEHILHAGDIGGPDIIAALERQAPVTAVLGNNDFGLPFRETEIVLLGGLRFLVHHIVSPRRLIDPIKGRIERAQPDAVIFGHTHEQFCERLGPTLYFNPGYAGKPRFNLPRSVALLHCEGETIRPEFMQL